jgi:hypothetical protein
MNALPRYPVMQTVTYDGQEWVVRSPNGIPDEQLQKAVELYNAYILAAEVAERFFQSDIQEGPPGDLSLRMVDRTEDRPEIRKLKEIMSARELLGDYSVE